MSEYPETNKQTNTRRSVFGLFFLCIIDLWQVVEARCGPMDGRAVALALLRILVADGLSHSTRVRLQDQSNHPSLPLYVTLILLQPVCYLLCCDFQPV
jgi:hypothetical protein